jgi:hypothetical protein
MHVGSTLAREVLIAIGACEVATLVARRIAINLGYYIQHGSYARVSVRHLVKQGIDSCER